MTSVIAVGAGGFCGAVLRYLIGSAGFYKGAALPVSTMLINFTGAFIIGAVMALAMHFEKIDSRIILFLTTGLCGGFTTFSTFSLETAELLSDGRTMHAFIYAAASVTVCVVSVIAGKASVSALVSYIR